MAKEIDAGFLAERLAALRQALPEEALSLQTSWQTARVFNALLAQAKKSDTKDVVLRAMGSIRRDDENEHLALADNATVAILSAQVEAALGDAMPDGA